MDPESNRGTGNVLKTAPKFMHIHTLTHTYQESGDDNSHANPIQEPWSRKEAEIACFIYIFGHFHHLEVTEDAKTCTGSIAY